MQSTDTKLTNYQTTISMQFPTFQKDVKKKKKKRGAILLVRYYDIADRMFPRPE